MEGEDTGVRKHIFYNEGAILDIARTVLFFFFKALTKEKGQVTVMAVGFQFYLATHREPLENLGQGDNAKGVNEKNWENDSQ